MSAQVAYATPSPEAWHITERMPCIWEATTARSRHGQSRHTGFDLATLMSVMALLVAGADDIFVHTGTRFVAYLPWDRSPFLLRPQGTADIKVALPPIIGFAAGLIIHLPFWRMHEARELGAEATNAAEAEQAQPGHSRKGSAIPFGGSPHADPRADLERRAVAAPGLDHERGRRPPSEQNSPFRES